MAWLRQQLQFSQWCWERRLPCPMLCAFLRGAPQFQSTSTPSTPVCVCVPFKALGGVCVLMHCLSEFLPAQSQTVQVGNCCLLPFVLLCLCLAVIVVFRSFSLCVRVLTLPDQGCAPPHPVRCCCCAKKWSQVCYSSRFAQHPACGGAVRQLQLPPASGRCAVCLLLGFMLSVVLRPLTQQQHAGATAFGIGPPLLLPHSTFDSTHKST